MGHERDLSVRVYLPIVQFRADVPHKSLILIQLVGDGVQVTVVIRWSSDFLAAAASTANVG